MARAPPLRDAAVLGANTCVILMRAEKTGTRSTIPILPELACVIDATKTGDLTFIATATGAAIAAGDGATVGKLARSGNEWQKG